MEDGVSRPDETTRSMAADAAGALGSRRLSAGVNRVLCLQRHELASGSASPGGFADTMLARGHLEFKPIILELTEDSAMSVPIGVTITCGFPRADRRHVRRLQSCNEPLGYGVVRNAIDADFAVAPELRSSPFDAIMKVLRLSRGEDIELSRAPPAATPIHTDAYIAVRDPFLRIDQLPICEPRRGALSDLGIGRHHPLPSVLVSVLEREALCVRTQRDNDRVSAVVLW